MKFFSLLYQGDVHPSTDEKVIPAETFSALVEAAQLIEKAKEDAAQLMEETKNEGKRLKEEAKKTGFQEGLDTFNEKIVQMDQELKKVRHEMHKMVLPIALQAAKKIVAKELATHPETIVDIVLQAIVPITQSHQVVIFVSKQDKEMLEKEKPRIKELLPHVDTLAIQEKDIEPGGCIIQTEGGMINATMENQWRSLERAFAKYLNSQP